MPKNKLWVLLGAILAGLLTGGVLFFHRDGLYLDRVVSGVAVGWSLLASAAFQPK